jgi:DNA end-binding protein Ku
MEDDVADPKLAPRKIELAEKLIETWTEDDFDFSAYKDTYQDKLKELIEAKVAGREIVSPAADADEPEVINLMEALQASVRRRKPRESGAGSRTATSARGGPRASRRKPRSRTKRAS